MTTPETSPVARLVLARLLLGGDEGATSAAIRKDVEPLLKHRWEGAALTELLDRTLDELQSAGLVVRAKKRGKEYAAITAVGRGRTLRALGIDQLPPRANWGTIKKGYLSAIALGLPTPSDEDLKDFTKVDGFRAALLARQFGLPLEEYPKLDKATDALSWKLIGFDSEEKFTPLNVLAKLIGRELGDGRALKAKTKPEAKKVVDKLLAKRVGARRDDVGEFRDAAIRRWVDEGTAGPGPSGAPPASVGATAEPTPSEAAGATASPSPPAEAVTTPPAAAVALDLVEFARRATAAARSSPTGRFGEKKVFIAHAWRAAVADPALGGMALDDFKRRLAEASRARLLDLGRADLVEAMDRRDVDESETEHLGATFHFLRI